MDTETALRLQTAFRNARGVVADRRKYLEAPERVYAHGVADAIAAIEVELALGEPPPVRMILFCPACGRQHIDAADPTRSWANPPHRSHLCEHCGFIWRPADIATTGVLELRSQGLRDHRPQIRVRAPEVTETLLPGEKQWVFRAARAFQILSGLRARGWTVAAHSDHRASGWLRTRWLMVRGATDQCVEAEGLDDLDALEIILEKLGPGLP